MSWDSNLLSPEDIEAIQNVWENLMKNQKETGRLLFQNLFEMYPEMGTFFTQFKEEGKSLMESPAFERHIKVNVLRQLTLLIGELREADKVGLWLARMGESHRPRGVKGEQFSSLGVVILATLEQALGPEFTGPLRDAWTTFIRELMSGIGTAISPTHQ